MASYLKNGFRIFLSTIFIVAACNSGAVIPQIKLFTQKEFDGNSIGFPLYPGCNNIWMFSWDKSAGSIVNKRQCIVLWDNMYCQGRSVRITPENETELRNLANIGFIHKFPSGLSSVEKCESEVCTALGTFLKPGYCTKYFRCTDPENTGTYIKKNYACPPKQHFDPKLGHCNSPDKIFPHLPCNEA